MNKPKCEITHYHNAVLVSFFFIQKPEGSYEDGTNFHKRSTINDWGGGGGNQENFFFHDSSPGGKFFLHPPFESLMVYHLNSP